MNYIISDVAERHIDSVEKIERSCFSLPWTRTQLLAQRTDDMHEFIGAITAEDEILGYVGMMYVIDEGYISNVAVAPEYQRQGIADELIDELLRRAEKHELAFVTLEVRQGNHPAISLYRKHGFSEVGLRKDYYTLPTENAILMTRFLK